MPGCGSWAWLASIKACHRGAISAFVGDRPSRDCATDAATLQKLSPAFTTQVCGLVAGVGAGGVVAGGEGGGGGAVVVVGGAVVVVGGAVVDVVDGGAVVVVVVVAGSVVTGGIADAGGPGVGPITGAVVVVANNGASVVELGGADAEEPASRSATDDPPPHAVAAVANAPTHSNHRQLRFTGGERSRGSCYLAKSRRNSRSPLLPTLAGPPDGLLML